MEVLDLDYRIRRCEHPVVHDRIYGNGDVVSDYDGIAPIYNQQGINLFVTDYRGYGSSGGVPTFTSMITDAHRIFEAFLGILHNEHYTSDVFAMGRSLGSMSAIELAYSYQEQVKGLISLITM